MEILFCQSDTNHNKAQKQELMNEQHRKLMQCPLLKVFKFSPCKMILSMLIQIYTNYIHIYLNLRMFIEICTNYIYIYIYHH